MGSRPSLFNPHVEQYLLDDQGEFIVDEIVKHPICMVVPMLITVLGIALVFLSTLLGEWWPPMLVIGFVVCCIGLVKFHDLSMDRFVVTNMRVYRVHGVLNRHVATVPLTRILDISVDQPFLGMICNYGHFTFQSAAEDQGLRHVTYVGHPKRRDLTIQRVIQRAGLRAASQVEAEDDGS